MKAIRLNIYRPYYGDCSNHGISSRFHDILLESENGFIDIDENNPPENLCVFVKRTLFGKEANYIEPYEPPKGAGWMYGGCIVDSSDARFPSGHPVRLFDRDESWDEYEMYSR